MSETLTDKSVCQLASEIARGSVSAAECVEAHIARIESVNTKLNAVVVKCYESARRDAARLDRARKDGKPLGALHGVPITIKECIDVIDTPSTFGVSSRAAHRAAHDDTHVARLRNAGAIIVGKTNVAQLLMSYESDNPLYGRTNNPWNLSRTPGGSSGGEGAIIAAGGSAMGLGTDIGGSVRIPAAFCGIASMKPTVGRTPDMGSVSVSFGQSGIASQLGVLARDVDDVALGLAVTSGEFDVPAEARMPLGDHRAVDVRGLRVACYTNDGSLAPAASVARVVREAAEMLRAKGAHVVDWTPPDIDTPYALFFAMMSADGGALMRRTIGNSPRDPQINKLLKTMSLPTGLFKLVLKLLGALGQQGATRALARAGHKDVANYWRMRGELQQYRERFARALDEQTGGPIDVILAPVCAVPAFTHGASVDVLTGGAYSNLYNVVGYPAGVVPAGVVRIGEDVGRADSRDVMEKTARKIEQGSVGLPIGVQVIARPWREHVALGVMRAIEQGARERGLVRELVL